MEHLLSIQRTVHRLEGDVACPPECARRIFVPAHGNDLQQYCFLIDLAEHTVTTWRINMDALVAHLADWVHTRYPGAQLPLHGPLEEYLYTRLRFHVARCWKEKLYLYPINGFFFLCLDLHSDDYQVIYEDPSDVYCSTNQIRDGAIYYTKWNLMDSFSRRKAQDDIPLTFGRYDIAGGRFEVLGQTMGPDNIHDTALSPDARYMVAVEMPRTVPVPPHPVEEENTPEHLLRVLHGGIGRSRILRFDLGTKKLESVYDDRSPSHIVFDKRCANTAYIADSNLWSTYCFGAGRMGRYDFGQGIRRTGSYEAEDFYRIPSHDILLYQGKSLLCATVFANQVHVLDAESMTLHRKISFSKKRRVPDFTHGPYRYPDHDRTPYTLHPMDGSPYLILASLWGIRILDVDSGRVVSQISYNTQDCPVTSMGHSICLERV